MTHALIRSLILTNKWNDGSEPSLDRTAFNASFICEAVINLALAKKNLDRKPTLNALQELQIKIHEVVWELVLEGIFAPGSAFSGYSIFDFPQLHITEHGKKCFEAGEITPHDHDQYLHRIKKESPQVDRVTLMYLGEALQTFKTRAFLASAVMLGVAAEKVLLNVVDAVKQALDPPDRQAKFELAISKGKAKQMHDEIMNRLKSSLTPLPGHLSDNLDSHIDGMYNLIRITRNDGGHPTGRVLALSEVDGLLRMFPPYCKTAHQLIDWLAVNKI